MVWQGQLGFIVVHVITLYEVFSANKVIKTNDTVKHAYGKTAAIV